MKIKDIESLDKLEIFGFEEIDQAYEENRGNYTIACYKYKYNLGHSRRGQCYYILVGDNLEIDLYASEPDGSGGSISLDNTLFKLITEGIIIES